MGWQDDPVVSPAAEAPASASAPWENDPIFVPASAAKAKQKAQSYVPWEEEYATPDGGPAPWEVDYETQPARAAQPAARTTVAPKPYSLKDHLAKTVNALKREAQDIGFLEGNLIAGGVRGAGSIGSTMLYPYDRLAAGGRDAGLDRNQQRRQMIDEGLRTAGATPESLPYKTGKIGSEVAGTAGMGGALANVARGAGAAPRVVSALQSGGFALGPGGNAATNALLRAGAGAAVGGASAGLVDPSQTHVGALIGGLMPGAVKLSGMAGQALTPKVKPEVADLYKKAQEYGIDVPLDRLVDSKPLNAAAASLNYVPFSGRMATENKMLSQINTAVSRTFGQDSDNVTMALRQAPKVLGPKFNDTLMRTPVNLDQQLIDDMADVAHRAGRQLAPHDAQIIRNQIDDIKALGASGQLEGQAAYNVKKTLDAMSRRKSNEASFAKDLRDKLMEAMTKRSMTPQEAAEFAKLREQYGNMIRMRKFAKNGAEGGVSVARLANMQDIHSPQLQDLADISAQFLRSREAPHGAAQRVVLGALGGGAIGGGALTGLLPVAAGGLTAGRSMNALLNSNTLKNAAVNGGLLSQEALDFLARNAALRTLPVTSSASP